MRGILNRSRQACSNRHGTGYTYGDRRLTAIVAIVTCTLAPGSALADSVIDASVQTYFVLGGWVTALVFLGIGLFTLRKALLNRRMAAAAVEWPTVDGTVISTDVVKRVAKRLDEFDYFVPRVCYAYETNGIRRQGNVIRIGLGDIGYFEEKKAREHLALYPVGATISVRYDPQNPEHAVLETGQIGIGGKITAGSILVGLGIAAVVFAIWSASLPTR